eukprot:TRINITY_DN6850_c0_g1_i8.p1 TRINITY_DN6850_c0_g1~~TRINITY_DN6850_c0_g1_i8.p1  ORF type:complete len:128 (+),score=10.61 TRINITY_DN6850_c0_g1_i8:181-564(+)
MKHIQQSHSFSRSELKFNLPFTNYLCSNGSSQSKFTVLLDLLIGLKQTSIKCNMSGCACVNPPSFALFCAECVYFRDNSHEVFFFSDISLRLIGLGLLWELLSVATFSCKVAWFPTNKTASLCLWLV